MLHRNGSNHQLRTLPSGEHAVEQCLLVGFSVHRIEAGQIGNRCRSVAPAPTSLTWQEFFRNWRRSGRDAHAVTTYNVAVPALLAAASSVRSRVRCPANTLSSKNRSPSSILEWWEGASRRPIRCALFASESAGAADRRPGTAPPSGTIGLF